MLQNEGWGIQQFVPLPDTSWIFPSGPVLNELQSCSTAGKIFDLTWNNISEHLLQETLKRDNCFDTLQDVNLFLASILVIGLTPHPEVADYFLHDDRGIFGSKWMQQHFTAHKWHNVNSHLHFDAAWVNKTIQMNCSKLWKPHQVLVIDEILVPFTGRWKWIQYIRGKPHNTGKTPAI